MKKISIISFIVVVFLVVIYNLIDLNPSFKSDFKINGVDISHYNKVYDWDKVKNHSKFCIIKASEGGSRKDPMFNNYWKESKKHKIVRGAYHFFTPGIPAYKQFLNFKNQVKLFPGDLPPILDVELKECDMNEVNKWLELVEEYYHVKPIIYSDFLFFKVFMERKVKNYPLWLYFNEKYKVKPSFNNFDCVFWQYNQQGKVSGMDGNTDLDTFLGDSESFNNLLIK